jgi:signal transduction histidine kinase
MEELRKLSLPDLAVNFPAAAWDNLWQAVKPKGSATVELQQRHKDGSTRPVELSVTYINVAGKESTTIFIRDLTERKNAEERRRLHEQQMQHLQRLESLGVLAGGIAHDFNNLLTIILGNISVARMDGAGGTDSDALLAEAEKASLKAQGLTAQLSIFSKGGKPVKSAVEIGKVIRESVSQVLHDQNVKCDCWLPTDLPPVNADAGQLAQVFNNLLVNACQASAEDGHIAIRAESRSFSQADKPLLAPGNYIEITVKDNGCGIPAEDLPKIFDPYFTTKKTGTGLGLAVVHSVIRHHHGAVSVDSQPGAGTTFTLLLPALGRWLPAASPPVPPGKPAGQRILIMDDETMICRVLSKMLSKLGYHVETAADGDAAVRMYQQAAAQQQPFDLLIMDLTVPGGMGGKETIQKLKQINPQVRSIVSSGYCDDPILANHQAYGFSGVILKPYAHDQVVAEVRKTLAR